MPIVWVMKDHHRLAIMGSLLIFVGGLLLMLMVIGCRAERIVVAKDGTGDFTVIQQAIDSAEAHDTIEVRNGTYVENLKIGKSLDLIGTGPDNTTIDGSDTYHVVLVEADYVNLSGFKIRRSCFRNDDPTGHYCSGVHLLSSFNRVFDNNLTENYHGVYIGEESSNNHIFSNIGYENNDSIVRIHGGGDNLIYNNTSMSIHVGIAVSGYNNRIFNNSMNGDGIFTYNSIEERLSNEIDTSNTVNGKPIYYWKEENSKIIPEGAGQIILQNCYDIMIQDQELLLVNVGISIDSSSKILINNNRIAGAIYGIWIDDSNDIQIMNNLITQNYNEGILITGSDEVLIYNNRIHDNFFMSAWITSSEHVTVVENNFTNNSYLGLEIHTTIDSSIHNNTFANNGQALFLRCTNDISVIDNQFISNQNDKEVETCDRYDAPKEQRSEGSDYVFPVIFSAVVLLLIAFYSKYKLIRMLQDAKRDKHLRPPVQ